METGLFLPLSIYNLVVYYIPSFPSLIKNRGDTRYGWLAEPYPMETFTPQETPSLLGALRTSFVL